MRLIDYKNIAPTNAVGKDDSPLSDDTRPLAPGVDLGVPWCGRAVESSTFKTRQSTCHRRVSPEAASRSSRSCARARPTSWTTGRVQPAKAPTGNMRVTQAPALSRRAIHEVCPGNKKHIHKTWLQRVVPRLMNSCSLPPLAWTETLPTDLSVQSLAKI